MTWRSAWRGEGMAPASTQNTSYRGLPPSSHRRARQARRDFTRRHRQEIAVLAVTLSGLTDQHGTNCVDPSVAGCRGGRAECTRRGDFARHAPRMTVAGDADKDDAGNFLADRGFWETGFLVERQVTRDRICATVGRTGSRKARALCGTEVETSEIIYLFADPIPSTGLISGVGSIPTDQPAL